MINLWGILISIIGLALFILARQKSNLVIYRFLVARAKVLWGDKAYIYHQVIGGILIIFGILLALKII